MVQYVEVLRAKRALIVAAVLLGLLLVAAIVLRLSFGHAMNPRDWAHNLQTSPTAHSTTQHLPDGTTRTIVDDPAKHTHAIIDQKGDRLHVEIAEPAERARTQQNSTMTVGRISTNENTRNGITHVTVDYRHDMTVDAIWMLLATLPLGLLVATMLGGALAKENDGHLELAWTKPASRERMALLAMLVDGAAIVASEAAAFGIYLCCILLFGIPHLVSNGPAGAMVLFVLIAPIAWYAALTAWSASLKSHLGMVIGLGWPAALIVPGIAQGTQGVQSPAGQAAHAVFAALSYIDPIAYVSFHGSNLHNALVPSMGWALVALASLTIVYAALSMLQWRRVEA